MQYCWHVCHPDVVMVMSESAEVGLFGEPLEQAAPAAVAVAAPRLRRAERRQAALRAVRLDRLMPDDHRVRVTAGAKLPRFGKVRFPTLAGERRMFGDCPGCP